GDNLYRARFSRQALRDSLRQVRELTADNREQQQALTVLEQLIDRKISVMLQASNLKHNALDSDELADVLSIQAANLMPPESTVSTKRPAGFAVHTALTEQSTIVMEQIREQLVEMRHLEEQLLADRSL